MTKKTFTLGAVAYAPKVVTIWEGFREYFLRHEFNFDYILFSNYETQVEALLGGTIDAAWNSPLAHLRSQRMARAQGINLGIGPMRDSDQDLSSVLVVKNSSPLQSTTQLRGRTIGFGAVDSPQARLIPLDFLRQSGLTDKPNGQLDFQARNFDLLVGKHGDHIGGERDAAVALINGEVEAAWMIDSNYQAFASEGTLPSGETRILCRTNPFDHCIFTISAATDAETTKRFSQILLDMKWSNPEVRPLLELEGLKEWRAGRESGFSQLERAIDSEQFYATDGTLLEKNRS